MKSLYRLITAMISLIDVHFEIDCRKWLQENQHLRYMWIPNTDTVVVVQCNPLKEGEVPKEVAPKYSVEVRLRSAWSLYKEMAAKYL